ncbi:MAG: hypothetical protein ACK4VN_07610 [Bacteroidales bacterium]
MEHKTLAFAFRLMLMMVGGMAVQPVFAGETRLLAARPCQHSLVIEADRDVYVAGETVFFRLHSVQQQSLAEQTELVNVVLHQGNTVNSIQQVMVLDGPSGFGSFLLEDTLQTGWYELLAFTNAMRGSHSQCMGRTTLYVVNRFDRIVADILQDQHDAGGQEEVVQYTQSSAPALKIQTDREVYGLRQQGKISLVLNDPVYEHSFLSVSVVPAASFFSDLPEQVSFPDFSGHPDIFPSERLGMVLTGRIVSSREDLTLQGRKVLLSTPDTMVNLMYSLSDASGIFHFQLNPGYYGRQVYLQVYEPRYEEGVFRVVPNNRFQLQEWPTPQPRDFTSGARDYVLQTQQAVRIARAYELPDRIRTTPQHHKGFLKPVYSNADYIVVPSDYIKLDDFQEIARELLFGLRLRRQGGSIHMRMLDARSAPSFFSQPPLVFVNGVLVRDLETLLPLNTDAIRRVELLNRRWALGDLDFEGALALFLEPSTGFPLHRGNVTVAIPAIASQAMADNQPEQDRPAHRVPDFRPLLLWEPHIRLKSGQRKELTFVTSDMDGDFRIRVSAIMPDGSIRYFFCDFSVQPLNP